MDAFEILFLIAIIMTVLTLIASMFEDLCVRRKKGKKKRKGRKKLK